MIDTWETEREMIGISIQVELTGLTGFPRWESSSASSLDFDWRALISLDWRDHACSDGLLRVTRPVGHVSASVRSCSTRHRTFHLIYPSPRWNPSSHSLFVLGGILWICAEASAAHEYIIEATLLPLDKQVLSINDISLSDVRLCQSFQAIGTFLFHFKIETNWWH